MLLFDAAFAEVHSILFCVDAKTAAVTVLKVELRWL